VRGGLRGALVVAEVALSVVALAAAGLFVHSLLLVLDSSRRCFTASTHATR
jgi:hypothetical protein